MLLEPLVLIVPRSRLVVTPKTARRSRPGPPGRGAGAHRGGGHRDQAAGEAQSRANGELPGRRRAQIRPHAEGRSSRSSIFVPWVSKDQSRAACCAGSGRWQPSSRPSRQTNAARCRLEFRELKPAVTRSSIGPGDRDPPGLEPPLPLRGHALPARLRRRNGPVDLPDPARPLVRSSSSGATRGGTRRTRRGRRARSRSRPGPGNPLGTRWMGLSAAGVGIHGTPDDASIGYSASHGCIRMHIPRRRVALQPRRHRHDGLHRLGVTMTVATQARRAGTRGRARARRCSRSSIWKVAQGSARRGRAPAKLRARLHAEPHRRARRAAAVVSCAGRRSCSTSGPPGASRASSEAPALAGRREALAAGRVVVLGVDVNDFQRRRARVHAQVRPDVPGRARQQERDHAEVRRSPACPRRSSSTGTARVVEHVPGEVTRADI